MYCVSKNKTLILGPTTQIAHTDLNTKTPHLINIFYTPNRYFKKFLTIIIIGVTMKDIEEKIILDTKFCFPTAIKQNRGNH